MGLESHQQRHNKALHQTVTAHAHIDGVRKLRPAPDFTHKACYRMSSFCGLITLLCCGARLERKRKTEKSYKIIDMTEEQRELVIRHIRACTIHPDGKIHATENADDVLEELNKSLGFDIKEQPDKVASVLEEAILSHDATDIECALHIAYRVGFRPVFMPLLITMLELTWHHSHEGIVGTFQYLKAPEPVEALYRTALVEHEYRAYDDFFGLARRCTYALAYIGTPEAYAKLHLLANCDNPIIAAHAQEHIDYRKKEELRKGA
jgi:hypothetical protein